jgi:hypothetical protein
MWRLASDVAKVPIGYVNDILALVLVSCQVSVVRFWREMRDKRKAVDGQKKSQSFDALFLNHRTI